MGIGLNRTASITVAACLVAISASQSFAQPGGGGMPGGGPNMPAFQEPKFNDVLWEAGGPRLSGLNDGKLVKGVQILGNSEVSSHKILSYMRTRQDSNYDDKQLETDIHSLYSTELFTSVRPSVQEYADGVLVQIQVEERPMVTEVIFHGNTRIDDHMLSKHCGIEVGDPANPFSADMARQRLLDLYQENGFNHAAIVIREGNKAGDRRLFFEISEGQLERIWSIKFLGNQEFSDSLLMTKIQSRGARYGATAYAFNKASMNKIRQDTETLTAYYRALGYFMARIDHRIEYHDSGFMDVTFVIDEGPQFFVRNISIVGNEFFSTEVLMQALQTKTGEPFNLGLMNKDQRTLRNDYYGREGFVFVDITPEPRFLEEPGQLDLVFRISEGDRYRCGDIRVHLMGDSSHTKHIVPLSFIGLRPGEIIDLRKLEAARVRLMRSQLFETNPTLGEPPRIEVENPADRDF